MLLTIAALAAAVARLAVPLLIQRRHDAGRDCRRAGPRRSRARSISRGRTRRKPTAWASNGLYAAGFDPSAMATFFGAAATRGDVVRRRLAVVPARPPRDLPAHRRSAGTGVHQAVPAGSRLARLPDGARAAQELRGHATRRRRLSSTMRWPRKSTTTRSPRTTVWSRRCCARRTSSARRPSSRPWRRSRRRTR